jgi:hypothetical protein
LRRAQDSDGRAILLIDGSLPPHMSGPPVHLHVGVREEVTVTAGTLGAQIGGKTIVATTGTSAVFPAGVLHNWWNAGDDVVQVSGRAVPAGDLDRFLQAIFAVVNATPTNRPSTFYLAHVIWRHRRTHIVAAPPRLVQRVMLPLIVLIGTLLGKYRGADWPGSPASCTGCEQLTRPRAPATPL